MQIISQKPRFSFFCLDFECLNLKFHPSECPEAKAMVESNCWQQSGKILFSPPVLSLVFSFIPCIVCTYSHSSSLCLTCSLYLPQPSRLFSYLVVIFKEAPIVQFHLFRHSNLRLFFTQQFIFIFVYIYIYLSLYIFVSLASLGR